MQKKSFISLLIIALSFAFVSCLFYPNQKKNSSNRQETPDSDQNNKVDTTFINNSSYDVNVFINAHRRLDGSVRATVKAGQKLTTKIEPSQTDSGDAFYFEYIIPIGNIGFPYFSLANSKAYVISANKRNEITIDELSSCPTKSAYLCVENNSTSSIYLVNYNTILSPQEQESHFIESSKCGVYVLGENNDPINYQSEKMYIQIGAQTITLPKIIFELGNIFTVTITNDNAILKSISPFDIDTQKQIWSFSDNSFNPEYPCILRNSYNNDGSNLIMGTSAKDPAYIGYKILDKYNSESTLYTFKIQNEEDPLLSSSVLDFVQTADRSIVMLLENTYRDKTDNKNYSVQFISSIDFDKQEVKDWSFEFPDEMIFRENSKNKFIYTNNGKIAIAGAVRRNNRKQMHRYFGILDISSETPTLSSFVSSEFTDISKKIETMFTSAWYDGTDFYVCGYDNWDITYSELTHKGIIYKFNPSDLNDNQEVFSYDRTLFFCIDGSDNNWYACGEYADNGKILKGCYISKNMADGGKEPVKYATYSTNRNYCYFTQLCCYQNKIIIAGKASDSFDESVNPLPIIVAFDKASDEILWENTNFTSYNNINAIIPNKIGTYVVQLQSDSHFHYVSADLLGNEKH